MNATKQRTIGLKKVASADAAISVRNARLYLVMGERLASIRASRGLSRQQLADLCGVGVNTVNHAELGDSYPMILLVSVAEVFDLMLEELIPTEATA